MEAVRSWTALIAATAIISAVFTALLPPGKTKSAFMTLVGIVIVCAVISPFASDNGLDFELFDDIGALSEQKSEFKNQSDNAARKVAESGFESALRSRVSEMGYKTEDVDVICNIDCMVQSVRIVVIGEISESKLRNAVHSLCGSVNEIKIEKKGEQNE